MTERQRRTHLEQVHAGKARRSPSSRRATSDRADLPLALALVYARIRQGQLEQEALSTPKGMPRGRPRALSLDAAIEKATQRLIVLLEEKAREEHENSE